MTDTYKVLGQSLTGQLALDGTTAKETILYQVPEGAKTSVSAITVTNSDSVDQSYRLSFIPSADVSTATANVSYNVVSQITETNTEAIIVKNQYYGDGYRIFYTQNGGENWIERSTGIYVNKVAYAFDKYWFTSQNQVFSMSSVNSQLLLEYTFGSNLAFLTYINGSLIASTNNGSGARYNGQAWTTFSLQNIATYQDPIRRGNEVVIYDDINFGAPVAYSSDGGINWNYGPTTPITFTGGIATNNQRTIGIRTFSSVAYYTDSNTWNWQQFTLPSWYVFSIVQAGQYFFLSSGIGLFYSADGLTWTQASLPAPYEYPGQRIKVVYANNTYYLINNNETPTVVMSSTNGTSWTNISSSVPTSQAFTDVVSRTITSVESVTNTYQQSVPSSLNKHFVIKNKTIKPNETHEVKGGITLSAGDQVRVYSTSNEIIANVYGVEIE